MVEFPYIGKLSGTKTMLLLTGEYEHTVDGKSRVLISNKLRNQIDAEKYFEQIALATTDRPAAPDESVTFERMSFALANKVELDRQGRLLLNEKLRKRAGLKDRITLVGVRDHIELWNSEDWEQYLADHMSQYQQQMSQARQVILQKQSKESLTLERRQDD